MTQSTLITRATTGEKVMSLTFDFGSDAGNLSEILRILAANNIKTTFFLTGKAAENYPALARGIIEQGHEIGNHSYSHPYFTQISAAEIESEMTKAENAIIRAAGVNPKPFFRPPYGSYNQTVLNSVGNLGYTYTIYWTIDTIDWNGTPAYEIIDKVLSNAQPGAIVLMHVGSGTHTTEALPDMISGLKAKGYSLTKISKMLSLTPIPSRPVLRNGSTGEAVRYLQQALTTLGYNPGPIDGMFGAQTEAAVRRFQSDKGLTVDGIVGPQTWEAIDKAMQNPPAPPPSSHPILRYGSTGDEVKYLQKALTELGFNPGPIDGMFGSKTEAAVKAFQSSRGLVADGIVGPKTWAAIDSEL